MHLVKNFVFRQKTFETIADFDNFIQKNGFDKASDVIIQSVIFDKETFAEKSEVVEWLDSKYIVPDQLLEDDKSFTYTFIDESELEKTGTTELRRGVSIKFGQIVTFLDETFSFSSRLTNSLNLSEELPHIIEIARVIDAEHKVHGPVKITEGELLAYTVNLNEGAFGQDVPINFEHIIGAAGWIKTAFLSEDKQTAFGSVVWSKAGRDGLKNKEFRYFSPELDRTYINPTTNKNYKNVITGGALTNTPFLKMKPIVKLSEKGGKVDTIKLTEHKAQMGEKDLEISNLKLSEKTAQDALAVSKTANEELTKTIAKDVEDKRIEKLTLQFSENKITKAAFEALKKDPKIDPLEILKLNEGLNTKANGSGGEGNETVQLSEDAKGMAAKLGMSEKDLVEFGED